MGQLAVSAAEKRYGALRALARIERQTEGVFLSARTRLAGEPSSASLQ